MSETTYYRDDASASFLDDDERYRLLSNAQRRATIRALDDRTGPVSLSTLAADVVRRRRAEGAECDPDDVRIQLHHVHLPQLGEAGLLRYDRAENEISRYEFVSALRP